MSRPAAKWLATPFSGSTSLPSASPTPTPPHSRHSKPHLTHRLHSERLAAANNRFGDEDASRWRDTRKQLGSRQTNDLLSSVLRHAPEPTHSVALGALDFTAGRLRGGDPSASAARAAVSRANRSGGEQNRQPRISLHAESKRAHLTLVGQRSERRTEVVVNFPKGSVWPQEPSRADRTHQRDAAVASGLVVDVKALGAHRRAATVGVDRRYETLDMRRYTAGPRLFIAFTGEL